MNGLLYLTCRSVRRSFTKVAIFATFIGILSYAVGGLTDCRTRSLAMASETSPPTALASETNPPTALAPEASPPIAPSKKPTGPMCWALLVGIDKYDGLPSLNYCSVDMHDLSRQLWERGEFKKDNIHVLTTYSNDQPAHPKRPQEPPTRKRILDRLKMITSQAQNEDVVLFAFSGHGLLIDSKSYLCPKNTPKTPTPDVLIDVIGDIYKALSECKASHKIVIIDACRSPPAARDGGKRIEVADKDGLRNFQAQIKSNLPTGIYGLFSCSDGQESVELNDLKHGLFMHFVIEGLKGSADLRSVNKEAVPDGNISIHEWFYFASEQTRRRSQDGQIPEMVARAKAPVYIATPSPLPPTVDYALPNGQTMRLRLVRRGEFTMGCNGVLANKNEKPAHRVFLTSDFYLGETEVTQGQYESCVGNNPVANEKSPWVDPQNPVVFVSFEDAKHFCDKLNEHIKFPPHAVHLPTEAQWEYAARAGVDNADQASDPAVLKRRAWFSGNALKHIHQVASLQKNRWGFYDMQGNVAEWVEDAYDACFYSKKTSGQDPVAPWVNSGARVVRGGAWISPAEECRTTDRNSMTPTSRERHIGFRVVIDVHPTHFDCGTQPDHPSGRK